jgi:hypothetical protein
MNRLKFREIIVLIDVLVIKRAINRNYSRNVEKLKESEMARFRKIQGIHSSFFFFCRILYGVFH